MTNTTMGKFARMHALSIPIMPLAKATSFKNHPSQFALSPFGFGLYSL